MNRPPCLLVATVLSMRAHSTPDIMYANLCKFKQIWWTAEGGIFKVLDNSQF